MFCSFLQLANAYFLSLISAGTMDVVSNITLYTDGPSIPSKLVDIPEFEHEAFRAVRQCRIDLVEECLNNGFDVNTKHEGESLL